MQIHLEVKDVAEESAKSPSNPSEPAKEPTPFWKQTW